MNHQEKIDSLIHQLQKVSESSTEARSATIDAVRRLEHDIETEEFFNFRLQRLGLLLPVTKIAQDLKLYTILVENKAPLIVADIATKVNAAPLLIQTDVDTFTANHITRILADPLYGGVTRHTFSNVGPGLNALPDFLKETKYQDIDDALHTPAQKAFNTPLHMFQYLPSIPERWEPLQQTMAAIVRRVPWFTVFPFKQELASFQGETTFVDIGCGSGHQSRELLGAFPELYGKIIGEDLQQALAHAAPFDGVQIQAYDFFTPQPVKNAKFYYMRHILHDWPEPKALAILANIKAAMGSESQLLIDEVVIPNMGAHVHSTLLDLIMMASLAALERTADDWKRLLGKAGFKILRIDTYLPRVQASIIQAVPK
ncbi:hypothetical protein VHEMI10712 [[Torrubiella] hemipterigena]|uniref:O-methyltransferase C-terminal domain-containing protein n=1 Tax=[Torrubiella] hemipterigena TaxID=1531966 RepID=A0A0A1TSQ1_9HYPO|nr:hypothetical protein VHEMI10712 [[Torrubiella] hemipterigena]